MSGNHVKLLIDHQYWADQKIIEALLKLETISEKSKKVMVHILAAQENWIARIEGRAPELDIWPEIRTDHWRDWSLKNYKALNIICQDEENLSKEIFYSNSTGKQFTNSISEVLLHLVMHSQYHRGQIMSHDREGFDIPPSTDMIVFLRSKSNEVH